MTGMNMNERSKALEGIRLSAGNAGKLTVGTQSVHAEPCKRDKVSVVICGRVGYEAALGFMLGENLADVVAGNTPNRVNEAFAQISESRCGRCIRTPDFLYAVYAPGVNGGEAAAADVYADDYLYDLRVDPVQLNNVVADPAYAEAKAMLRGRLLDWIKRAEGAEPTIVD